MRCGDCEHFNACLEFWHSDYSLAETIEKTAVAYEDKDSCKHFRYTDFDASDVKAISDELDEIEHEIDKLDEEITSIKAKMTIAKTKRGKPMSKECQAWFDRAGVALSIKNNQLRKLHIEKMRTEKALKAAKADVQKRRERIQNELFYAKLKELMSDGELRAFLEECQRKLEVATDESCHRS